MIKSIFKKKLYMYTKNNFIKEKAILDELIFQFNKIKKKHLRDFFIEDKNRFNDFSINYENIFLDYSKNHINKDIINTLIKLAKSSNLSTAIKDMFSGKPINKTEKRSVLHTAIRNFSDYPIYINKKNIMPDIKNILLKMKNFSKKILSGEWRGYTNKKITDIVNIGIGGSDLGPIMITEALKHYKTKINIHFVSNVDASSLIEVLKIINPETTLFIIASKTFSTQETITNAISAKNWFLKYALYNKNINKHFVAVSVNHTEVMKFGINQDNTFYFWDWIGGRYSLWGPIGLSISLYIGFDNFEKLLQGAYQMDTHFRNTPFHKNIPVILALLSIWYINFFNINNHVIIPYEQYLNKFTDYIQQVDMESNGKNVDKNGFRIQYSTGPIIWGGIGTNSQHSFYQSLHQGTSKSMCDFIISKTPIHNIKDHHEKLFANFLAQSYALAFGNNYYLNNKKIDSESNLLTNFKKLEGNHPINLIILKNLTPFTLGNLISMYEHKIFVQGIIWNICSFDQWGVEFGKKLANNILLDIKNNTIDTNKYDISTINLIKYYKNNN